MIHNFFRNISVYNFSVLIHVHRKNPGGPPIEYYPTFSISLDGGASAYDPVPNFVVVTPSTLLPRYIHYASGSTNVSNQWSCSRTAMLGFALNSTTRVAGATPTASFTVNTNTGTAPLSVTFTDTSSGVGITAWNWNFGDGTWENRTTSTNPVHTYAAGTWYPRLTVTNSSGSQTSPITPAGTITATPATPAASTRVGVYKDGTWYLDMDGSGTWNAGDRANNFGAPGWTSVPGDWNGDGKTEISVYQNGVWYQDYNGNGAWDTGVDNVSMFGALGWTPTVGDWNGNGKTKIGVYKDGVWYLDNDGSGTWSAGDAANMFGAARLGRR